MERLGVGESQVIAHESFARPACVPGGDDGQIRVGDKAEAPDSTNDQEAFGHWVIADFERRKCRSEFIA